MSVPDQCRSLVGKQSDASSLEDSGRSQSGNDHSTCNSYTLVPSMTVQNDEISDESVNNNDEDNDNEVPLTLVFTGTRENRRDQSEIESTNVKVGMERNQGDLLYQLTQNPPLHFLIFFAMQQCFLVISTPLSTTMVVAEAVCAQNDDLLKVRILSATFFMMGFSTFAMTTFGVRLPIFQGPTAVYVIPLLALKSLGEFRCPDTFLEVDPIDNSTRLMAFLDNATAVPNRDVSLARINAYAGSLIAVGAIHFLIGAFGLVSIIAKLVGPITIVPVVMLFGIYMHEVIVTFVETHWPTALITSISVVVLGLYLENHDTPIPFWMPSKGFHVRWHPLHRIFALLISIILGWTTCAFLTVGGVFTEDKDSKEYLARTDARFGIVQKTDWFIFPYPGQFGIPGFSLAAMVSFMISCILSVLDSIGDYNVTAQVTSTPRPPNYALNRGIAVEGIMSVLGGAFGCSHGTVSFGENIGAIGISRVASRSVFQVLGIFYIVFAFLGKIGAFFITIPYSVIGGTQIVTYGMLIGVLLSYLEAINLRSQRNLSILGITLLMGLVVPRWMQTNPHAIQTRISQADNIIHMLLGNPSFVGGFLACLLDNTIPGTAKDRGITAQTEEIEVASDSQTQKDKNSQMLDNTIEVYRLSWMPSCVRKSRLGKLMPIFDTTK